LARQEILDVFFILFNLHEYGGEIEIKLIESFT